MKLLELAFRSWYYFRLGYGTYLAFLVGFATFVSTTYYLAVTRLPFLQEIFVHFYVFVVFVILVIVPLSVLIGWFHMKRTIAHPTDIAINVEANPYNYMIMPGKETEVNRPYQELVLRMLQKVLEKEDLLSAEEKRELEEVLDKLERLKRGEVVGRPRQRRIMAMLEKEGKTIR